MTITTLFNLNDYAIYENKTWQIIKIKFEQGRYDKQGFVYYYITNNEQTEIRKWTKEQELKHIS